MTDLIEVLAKARAARINPERDGYAAYRPEPSRYDRFMSDPVDSYYQRIGSEVGNARPAFARFLFLAFTTRHSNIVRATKLRRDRLASLLAYRALFPRSSRQWLRRRQAQTEKAA